MYEADIQILFALWEIHMTKMQRGSLKGIEHVVQKRPSAREQDNKNPLHKLQLQILDFSKNQS